MNQIATCYGQRGSMSRKNTISNNMEHFLDNSKYKIPNSFLCNIVQLVARGAPFLFKKRR